MMSNGERRYRSSSCTCPCPCPLPSVPCPPPMAFIHNFITNPVKVAVFVILMVMFGLIAIFRMPIQLIPDVEIPTLQVETRWPGASPEEIETEIVKEQEEQLKGVEGLVKMTSESMDSRAQITLEFVLGT